MSMVGMTVIPPPHLPHLGCVVTVHDEKSHISVGMAVSAIMSTWLIPKTVLIPNRGGNFCRTPMGSLEMHKNDDKALVHATVQTAV
jgi:hypothetical protein